MRKIKMQPYIKIIILMILTSIVATYTFFSEFGELTVDYAAAAASLFLIIGGMRSIKKNKCVRLRSFLSEVLLVLIGVCIFTIHFWQFIQK